MSHAEAHTHEADPAVVERVIVTNTEAVQLVRDIYLDAGANADDEPTSGQSQLVWIEDFEGKVRIAATTLSAPVVQYLTDADGTKTIERWVSGEARPSINEARRVCIASTIAKRFADNFPDAVNIDEFSPDLQAWFLGGNPTLGEQAPVDVIRTRPFREAATLIAAAAIGAFS